MNVIEFPRAPVKPRCFECENAMFGSAGTYCREYQEDIWDEATAEDCGEFTAVPWASYTGKEAT